MLEDNYGQFVSMKTLTVWPMDVHKEAINKLQPTAQGVDLQYQLTAFQHSLLSKSMLADVEPHFDIYSFKSINSIINLENSLYRCLLSICVCFSFLYDGHKGRAEIVPLFK